MGESTTRQLWEIDRLLRQFGLGGGSTASLRRKYPTSEAAAKVVEMLKQASHREAERNNKLPVEQRLRARKALTKSELEMIKGAKYEQA